LQGLIGSRSGDNTVDSSGDLSTGFRGFFASKETLLRWLPASASSVELQKICGVVAREGQGPRSPGEGAGGQAIAKTREGGSHADRNGLIERLPRFFGVAGQRPVKNTQSRIPGRRQRQNLPDVSDFWTSSDANFQKTPQDLLSEVNYYISLIVRTL